MHETIREKEHLNHQAYDDVLDCLDPQMPDNPIYMECYRTWRPLQRFPGEQEVDLY